MPALTWVEATRTHQEAATIIAGNTVGLIVASLANARQALEHI